MQADKINDRLNWGRNIAARAVGSQVDAYRPQGDGDPLAARNRYLRLHASFKEPAGSDGQGSRHGGPIWQACFDAAYTRAGDYLVDGNVFWFIASQRALGPLLCVQTNRRVVFLRPSVPDITSTNAYGGVTAATSKTISGSWPANIMNSGMGVCQRQGFRRTA